MLWSGQEMPTLRRAGTSIPLQKFCLLCGCHRRCLTWIETDGKDLKLVADIEFEHAQGALQSAKDFSTEHGALVVDEVEDHRLFVVIICQTNLISVFIVTGK